MKKGEYFFQFLTDEEKVEFKKACEKELISFDHKMNRTYANFEHFMLVAFYWRTSTKGIQYWHKISLREIQEPQTQSQ